MTVTPSPQSVVVPVAVLNEAAGVLDCEGYGPLSMSLLSCLSAPAPSSLAGGEVDVERAPNFGFDTNEPTLRQVIEFYYRAHGMENWPNLAAQYCAALSPEAPAREGVKYTIRQEYGFGITEHDPALTPRHEAPASGVDAIRSRPCHDEHQAGCDCVIPTQTETETPPFLKRMADAKHEAPAEGAGERTGSLEDLRRDLIDLVEGPGDYGSLTNRAGIRLKDQPAWVNFYIWKSSARSSAPEAREGEAVAWRPVVGFKGHYEVSAFGDVRNIKTGKVLAKNTMGRGYIRAEFWKDGERTQTSVHRVVAEAFLPRRAGLDEVNHIDGDKANNAAWNLEWTNRKGNTDHSRYVLGNDVIAVLATDKVTGRQEYYPSIEEAGRYGYNASCIQMCLKGQREDHAGKLWTKTPFREPTHPAAPSADKLRESYAAVGAVVQRAVLEGAPDHEIASVARQALAILKAEGC